ncbi:MAG TPA: hypothetical protein VHY48_01855 [Acidobacteriaceae bacterium]|nr:hypothetical protein [Acidobacteriaceae bacterium]
MIRRVMGSTMVLAAVLLAGETVYAAPFHKSDVPAHAKVKLVSFNLRNDSRTPLKVKAGDQELTLAPGKVTPVKLATGTTIVAEETTPEFEAGAVLATVASNLSDATIALK